MGVRSTVVKREDGRPSATPREQLAHGSTLGGGQRLFESMPELVDVGCIEASQRGLWLTHWLPFLQHYLPGLELWPWVTEVCLRGNTHTSPRDDRAKRARSVTERGVVDQRVLQGETQGVDETGK